VNLYVISHISVLNEEQESCVTKYSYLNMKSHVLWTVTPYRGVHRSQSLERL